MAEAGYLSQVDYSRSVREGELYTILFGDLVAVGFDSETGITGTSRTRRCRR